MKAGLLIDTTKCVGCHSCMLACKEANALPADENKELSAATWTLVENHHGVHVRRLCLHCLEPACASVCPVGALQKMAEGAVVYDESKCIGCRYCMMACPFGVPRYEWSKASPRMRKCNLCYESASRHGRATACAAVCPSGATKFGERAALLGEAEARLRHGHGRYVNQIYGREEAGGTSVMYLAAVEFGRLGFRGGVERAAYPPLTGNVLSRLPNVVSVAGVALAGVWWLAKRRDEVAKEEGARPGAGADAGRGCGGEPGPGASHGAGPEQAASDTAVKR